VTVFDADGVVLWERAVADTVVGLPAEVPLQSGRPYYWIVAARSDFDRWETSGLIEFTISSGNIR
jgi:hypothetical protein